nr:glycosyltransferase family 2 protein [Actibacterium pelagium]
MNIPNSYRRFPDYDGSLPAVPKGVRIVRPEEDWGPATKVLAATNDLKGVDCNIAFCDDDRIMPPHWAQSLIEGKQQRPNDVISFIGEDLSTITGEPVAPSRMPRAKPAGKDFAYRWARLKQQIKARQLRSVRGKPLRPWYKKPGYVDTLYGTYGALVRPEYFDDQVYDIPPVLWSVDDFWLSGSLERKGIGIWTLAGPCTPDYTPAHEMDALEKEAFDGAGRHDANRACVKYMQETYGIWPASKKAA